jgi:hypothetical protein
LALGGGGASQACADSTGFMGKNEIEKRIENISNINNKN